MPPRPGGLRSSGASQKASHFFASTIPGVISTLKLAKRSELLVAHAAQAGDDAEVGRRAGDDAGPGAAASADRQIVDDRHAAIDVRRSLASVPRSASHARSGPPLIAVALRPGLRCVVAQRAVQRIGGRRTGSDDEEERPRFSRAAKAELHGPPSTRRIIAPASNVPPERDGFVIALPNVRRISAVTRSGSRHCTWLSHCD